MPAIWCRRCSRRLVCRHPPRIAAPRKCGSKAVAYHPPGTPFDNDKWELFHLDRDFSEADDLVTNEPERLAAMIDLWWREAEQHNVLPLDDRFGPRFAENAARFHGARKKFTFHAGMGEVPAGVAA